MAILLKSWQNKNWDKMFTYFKKKQEEQKETTSTLPGYNSKSQTSNKNQQNIMSSIKLPSNILAKLLNQSAPVDNSSNLQDHEQQQSTKRQSKNCDNSSISPTHHESTHQQHQLRQQIRPQGNTLTQNQQKLPQTLEVHRKQNTSPKNNSINQSDIQQIAISDKFPLSPQSGRLSTLSQKQLTQLFTMFADIMAKTIESQLIGQKLQQQQLDSHFLPSTLETIQKINSNFYENFILETKEKYNQLVDQSTNLYLKSRQIANLVNQFVMSINLFFQSEELSIPAQEIQKAIAELNPQKTQKYMNYLIKIFESNFDDVIQKRVKNTKHSLQNEIRKSQKQIKELQQQIKRVNSILKQKQSTFSEQQSKFSQKELTITSLKRQINELNIKLNTISSSSRQTQEDYHSELSLLKRQLQRSKKQCQQLTQKNRKQLKMIQKKDNLLNEKQDEIEKLGQVIKKVKQVENEGMENIVQQMQMKQKMFSDKIEKFNTEKIQLQHQIRTLIADKENHQFKFTQLSKQSSLLKAQIANLKSQIQNLKDSSEKGNSKADNKQQKQQHQQSQDQENNTLEVQVKNKRNPRRNKNNQQEESEDEQKQINMSNLINKQIFRHLFLSFDDESKQWAVRNNIRNQIYIMLDVKKGINNSNNQDIQKKNLTTKASGTNPSGQNHPKTNPQDKKMSQGSLIGKWLGW